jgi:hypothetical protein
LSRLAFLWRFLHLLAVVACRSKTRHESVIISAGIAILAAVVLICAGLVVVPLWTALVQGWRFQPIADQCKMLKDAHARAACEREADGRSFNSG